MTALAKTPPAAAGTKKVQRRDPAGKTPCGADLPHPIF